MRKRFCFKGKVQHVGFRFRAVMAANRLSLTGWVQNRSDGSVILEAQGEDAGLRELEERLLQSRFGTITVSSEEMPEQDGESGFAVRYSDETGY